MYFKVMSKVVKDTCRLCRYNYTHDQLNTRHFISFFRIFSMEGAQNLSLPPGRQLPSLRHCDSDDLVCSVPAIAHIIRY